jgi:hypothetical protein
MTTLNGSSMFPACTAAILIPSWAAPMYDEHETIIYLENLGLGQDGRLCHVQTIGCCFVR